MESLSKEIPKNWKNNIEGQWKFLEENGAILLTEKETKTRTLSVTLLPNPDDKRKINEKLLSVLPEQIDEYVVLQPWEGYHFSVQWVSKENLKNEDVSILADSIKSDLKGEGEIRGKMIYPLLGKKNLFGIFDVETTDRLMNMRSKLENIWQEKGWKVGIPEGAYEMAWMSLARFKKKVPDNLIRELKSLEPITEDLVVNTVRISINDEFLTPDKTKVLGEIGLIK